MKSTNFFIVAVLSIGAIAGMKVPLRSIFYSNSAPAFVSSLKRVHREPGQFQTLTRNGNLPADEWIPQKLDHFNDSDTRTWQMRYLSNGRYFVEGCPIFIVLGGDWEISHNPLLQGHFHDMAKEHNGTLFYLEHRYYGKSRPTPDLSTANLKHLNVQQALADIAHFISIKKAEIPGLAQSKVIMAGGSYAGSLVVWFKRLYPKLIDGGWASSAPLLAKMDFFEYKEIAGEAIRELGSEQCYNRIHNGIAELEKMFAVTNRSAEAKNLLRICDDFDEKNDLDLWTLFGSITLVFSDSIEKQVFNEIQLICDSIMISDDDLTGVVDFNLQGYENSACWTFNYVSVIEYLSSSTEFAGPRQWYYQLCNEFGWFQTTASTRQPFGTKFPVTFYSAMCSDLFGKQYTSSFIEQQIENTNKDLGGLNPNVKNIYMTQGEFDPWRSVGYTAKDGAVIIPLASHWKDYGSISSTDSTEMIFSKEAIAKLVSKWVRENSAIPQ